MTDTDDRPLDPEKPYYTWSEYEGRLSIASECCGDSFSEAEERVLLEYLLKKHGNPALDADDWKRVEASLRDTSQELERYPAGPAYRSTFDKVQALNQTGPHTPQGGASE